MLYSQDTPQQESSYPKEPNAETVSLARVCACCVVRGVPIADADTAI